MRGALVLQQHIRTHHDLVAASATRSYETSGLPDFRTSGPSPPTHSSKRIQFRLNNPPPGPLKTR